MRPGKARASPWQRGRMALALLASGSDVQKGARGETMAQEAAGWPPEETLSLWKREQARLKARVVDRDTEAWQRDPAFSGLQRVGGVDVSFVKGDSVRACASLVVLSYPELEVLGWPATLASLQTCLALGWPRNFCRWMGWRTTPCTRRRSDSCRLEETRSLCWETLGLSWEWLTSAPESTSASRWDSPGHPHRGARRRGQWHAPEETLESPQVRAGPHRTTAQAPGQPQSQAPRSRRARTGSRVELGAMKTRRPLATSFWPQDTDHPWGWSRDLGEPHLSHR
ncbi:endonuclease V isoform X5 [Chlorocebus sabaeus]|uniref:endonuclease V isoform X5 n=1 Tax=Chlorocebus sabaeus TaxID=60711 RepID=UPI003BF9E16A